jgi:protein SCO1/2
MKPALQRQAWLASAVALAVAVAAVLAYRGLEGSGGRSVELPPGKQLEVAQVEPLNAVPDFALERLGGTLTPEQLRGRWAFLFFGYTNCPDACPQTMAVLSHVQESLKAQGAPIPRIVFISLDPRRDTPKLLDEYLAAFGTDAVGATGAETALRPLTAFFGVSYQRREGADARTYWLDHTTNFFLVTPEGRWLATFSPAEDPEAIASDTLALLQAKY